MTDNNDSLESRIVELLAELRTVRAAPRSINPDGTPGPVAPGELIESAWGNAVADAFERLPYTVRAGKATLTTTSSGTAVIELPVAAASVNVSIDRPTFDFWRAAGSALFVSPELSPDGTEIALSFYHMSASGAIVPVSTVSTMVVHYVITGNS